MAVRAVHLGLWSLVALGATAGAFAALRPGPGSAVGSRAEPPLSPAVAGVAELAVQHWLVSGHTAPAGPPPTAGAEAAPALARPDVLATTTVAVRAVEERYWAVTVAAHLRPGPDLPPEVWFLEVGVTEGPGGLSAVGDPAVVPAPPVGPTRREAGPALARPDPRDPLAATAQSFLEALLTGSGDLSRYLAPGASAATVDPPPFTTVVLEATATVTADEVRAVVRARVLATTAAGAELRPIYELTLTRRAGRWEVARLSGAPTLGRSPAPPAGPPATVAGTRRPPPTVPGTAPVPGA